jgi:hypothetical protein
MIRYQVHVEVRDVEIGRRDLTHWNLAKSKKRSQEILARSRLLRVYDCEISVPELQDCVDRAGEQFSPEVTRPLELFWNARRGVLTYYSPLELGSSSPSGYVSFASISALGEGVALFLAEDTRLAPEIFSLELMCRPLGESPDLMMFYRNEPERAALVEAKATMSENPTSQLLAAVQQLLEVLKGWQTYRNLSQTDSFGISTSVGQEGVFVSQVIRMRWGDR